MDSLSANVLSNHTSPTSTTMEALSTITPTALYASIPFVVAFVGGFGYWITGIARQIMQAENFKR